MSALSTIITQMSASQTTFNAAIKNKIASLKSKYDTLAASLGIKDQPGGYVSIDNNGDSTIQRDGTVNRDLYVGRNLDVAGNLTINGQTISGTDNSVVMAIALG